MYHACYILYVYTHAVKQYSTTTRASSSLHVQPRGVVEVHPLVSSRTSPLDLDKHGLVQTEGAVAVMESSLWVIQTQVALCTVTERGRERGREGGGVGERGGEGERERGKYDFLSAHVHCT